MNLRAQPGQVIGDRCPACGGPSAVTGVEYSDPPVRYRQGGLAGSISLGGPSFAYVIRNCVPCGLGWVTTISAGPGSDEILKEVRFSTPPEITLNIDGRLLAQSILGSGVLSADEARSLCGLEEPPAPPPAPPPAILGRVIGYRAWKINSSSFELFGTGNVGKGPWVPGVNVAKCATNPSHVVPAHVAPELYHDCGIYALARFSDRNKWWKDFHVLGAIEAWSDADEKGNEDRFFLHPDPGFRAQYGKIVLLATSDDFSRLKNDLIRKVLAPHYGVDVVKREHLEDAAKEHGRLVPDELVQWAQRSQLDREQADRCLAGLLPPDAAGDAVSFGDDFAIPHPSGFLVPGSFAKRKRERAEDDDILKWAQDPTARLSMSREEFVAGLLATPLTSYGEPGKKKSKFRPFRQTP